MESPPGVAATGPSRGGIVVAARLFAGCKALRKALSSGVAILSVRYRRVASGAARTRIEAAARSLAVWLEGRRCPYADLDRLLASMARAYTYLAGSMKEIVASESAGAWGELMRDLNGVHGSVARVLTAMYRESIRQV